MGHLRKRGKGWQYTVCLGRDPITGNLKQKSKGGFKTKEAARVAMMELELKISKEQYYESENMSIKEYLEYWMDAYSSVNVAYSTFKRYKDFCNTINDYLGNFELGKLKPLQIQKFYSSLIKAELSNSTILKIHRMFRMALTHAVGWQMLLSNPTDTVKPPRPEDYEVKAWDAETSNAFIDTIKDESIYLPTLLALDTGMRQGEIGALRWEDIDFDNKKIFVKHTMQRDENKELIIKTPKTKNSKRAIKLMDQTVKVLRYHKNVQRLNKLVLGDEYDDKGYVCAWPDGRPIDPHYVCSRFAKLITKYKFPELTFHGLRHTHATLLLLAGVPAKVVSERLGHSSITITLDLYSHVLPDMQQDAVDKLSIIMDNARQNENRISV